MSTWDSVFGCFPRRARPARSNSGNSASGGQTPALTANAQPPTGPARSHPILRCFSKVRSYLASWCCAFPRSKTTAAIPPNAEPDVADIRKQFMLGWVIFNLNSEDPGSCSLPLRGAVIAGHFNVQQWLAGLGFAPTHLSPFDQMTAWFETMRRRHASLEKVQVLGELDVNDAGAMQFLNTLTRGEASDPEVSELTLTGSILDRKTVHRTAKELRRLTQSGRPAPSLRQVILELQVSYDAQVLDDVQYLVERGAKLQSLPSPAAVINIDPENPQGIEDLSETARTLASILRLHEDHPQLGLLSSEKTVQATFDNVQADEKIPPLLERARQCGAQVAIVGRIDATLENLTLLWQLCHLGATVDGTSFGALAMRQQESTAVHRILRQLLELHVDVRSLCAQWNRAMNYPTVDDRPQGGDDAQESGDAP
jgi:hypothetical protein